MHALTGFQSGRFRGRHRDQPPAWTARLRNDEAVAEVISSVLIVAMTVLMTAGLVTLLLAYKPGPADPTNVDMTVEARSGVDDWGSGDEVVAIKHVGGERLTLSDTVVLVTIGDQTTRYAKGAANPLDHAGETTFDAGAGDEAWTIGERWTTPAETIGIGTRIQVNIVDTREQAEVVWSASSTAGSVSCGTDLTPPRVTAWQQTPDDVDTQTTGDVEVQATVRDICNTVDATSPPELQYRLNDGSDPSWNTVTLTQNGDDWTGQIPDPNWAAHATETLEYQVTGMTDSEGNTGDSGIQSDPIQIVGTETYVTSFTDITGTSTSDSDAQADDGNEAELQEGANGTTSPPLVTNRYNAQTATTTGSFTSGSNGGASDDVYDSATGATINPIQYPLADETGTPGSVEYVNLKAEVAGNQHVNAWYLTPCLPSGAGCAGRSGNLGTPTTDTTLTYNVTNLRPGGGTWSLSDVNDLEIEVDGDGQNANARFDVDHVYAEVTYRPSGSTIYNLNIKADILGGADGPNLNVLDGEYRAVDEDFEVYVMDFTAGNWVKVADLTSSTADTFQHVLTTDQIDASDNVEVRFLDATDGGTQGSLFLDYLRVVAT